MVKKILLGIVGLLVIVAIGFFAFVNLAYDSSYDAEYPITEMTIEADSAMIERGRYLAQGPAHCIDCHAPMELVDKSAPNEEVPMTGGFGLEIPPGKFYGPNITSDKETGIGRYTDGQLYRMLRYNVRPDGRAAFDFMPFINMSDEDIYAMIAYMRNQKPVKNDMTDRELTFLGKMLLAVGAIKPRTPDKPILKRVEPDTTVEYGRYLAYAVANCMGCHTDRDLKTGEYISEPYSGGFAFGPDDLTQGWVYRAPNITPDEETGIMADWDEEMFIDRMRAGKAYDTSPMPWKAFERMTDNDLKALYRFLMSLEPVKKEIKETVLPPQNS